MSDPWTVVAGLHGRRLAYAALVLRCSLLGPVALWGDGVPVALGETKQRSVLGLLLTRREREPAAARRDVASLRLCTCCAEDLPTAFLPADAPPDLLGQALRLQRDLAHHHGMWHRTPIPGLLIAETALHHGLGVVHVDDDFTHITEVRPLTARRLGATGGLRPRLSAKPSVEPLPAT